MPTVSLCTCCEADYCHSHCETDYMYCSVEKKPLVTPFFILVLFSMLLRLAYDLPCV